jgi:ribose/xylose/arabinose/galactoside ABC-type transport system permease subunit
MLGLILEYGRKMKRMDHFQRLGLLAFLMVMGAFFSVMSPYFLTWENLANILVQSTVLIIVGAGMTLVIATAGIDLSIGSILALGGIVMAALMKAGFGVLMSTGLGLLSGAFMGLLNGLGVAKLRISPFIVTLGAAGIYRALGLIFTDARPIYGLPMEFRAIATGSLGPLPLCVTLAFAIVILTYLIMAWTPFGAHVRAVGDNSQGAYRMGVPVGWVLVRVYVISGVAAALAGTVVTARLNTAEAIAGLGMELEAIAAVVMGGTSFFGGEASISGTLLGALLIGTLANGLTIINVPSYYQQLVIGIVFVAAVMADRMRRRKAGEVS